MKTNKGFTLIELLVVIAIIGILSSVVLASLNTARDKGADAAIKANLNGTRAQAELIYDDDKDYDAVCGANSVTQDPNIKNAVDAADDANGTGGVVCGKPTTGAASAWAIAAALKTSSTTFYCVDSTGNAGETATNLTATAVVCTGI